MGTGGGIGCLIFGVLFLVVAYYILKGVFALLWWAAPALFVLTLILDWRVVADTGKSFLKLLERNPLGGLLAAGLGIVAFPILALYLFLSAIGRRRANRMMGTAGSRPAPGEEEFAEFEELESRPKNTPPLEPPPMPEKEPQKAPEKPQNPYDDIFEN